MLAKVVRSRESDSLRIAQGREPPPADPHGPTPQRDEIRFHFKIVELAIDRRHFLQQTQERGNGPLAVAHSVQLFPQQLAGCCLERGIERFAGSLDAQILIQHQQLLRHAFVAGIGRTLAY
jgi:hypothetical protein